MCRSSPVWKPSVVPVLARAVDLATRKPFAAVPLDEVLASGGLSSLITDQILGPKQTFTYKGKAKLPTATYTGLVYDPNAKLEADYTPKQSNRSTAWTPRMRRASMERPRRSSCWKRTAIQRPSPMRTPSQN